MTETDISSSESLKLKKYISGILSTQILWREILNIVISSIIFNKLFFSVGKKREMALIQCQYPCKTFPCLPFHGGT